MITIACVGNPNVGKTALINAIAKSDLEVGNWSGVTVEKKEVVFEHNNIAIHLFDLPGSYTLSPYTLEEKVTQSVLLKESIDAIVNVVDTTNLRRNLYLTLELIEMQKPLVVSLNMYDDFSKRGYDLDIKKLESLLGMPCIATIASKKIGIQKVLDSVVQNVNDKKIPTKIVYQEHLEKEIKLLSHKMKHLDFHISKRFIAIKLIEDDTLIQEMIEAQKADYLIEQAKEARQRLQSHFNMPIANIITHLRYEVIDKILEKVLKKPVVDRVVLTDKIDSFVLNKYLGIPVFLLFMYLMFKFTFDGSAPLINWMGSFFEDFLSPHLRGSLDSLPNWLVSLITDGIISGVGLVLSFLPLLFFLYLFMAILEESGYMARVSFLLDKLAQTLGVKGNAFISLIIGFGCNVPAIYATRTLTSKRERIITALMVPLMSCSARLPIYALFTSLFFKENQALVIMSLYFLGIVLAFFIAYITNKFLPKNEIKPFFLELPTYHTPTFRAIWISMKPKLKDFIYKAGSLIVLASVLLWGIINLPLNSNANNSYLAQSAQTITPLFKPVGFGEHWEPVAALIPGTLAKEVVVGSLGTIYGVENQKKSIKKEGVVKDLYFQLTTLFQSLKLSVMNMLTFDIQILQSSQKPSLLMQKLHSQFKTSLDAFSYLVFILLYIPCVSTMAAIKSEFGWKLLGFEIVFLPLFAYMVSFFIYKFGSFLGF
ncbi:Ferrous iron transport protein B [hydrothermal vent metagenome]|uniref:Ferrous iron transport protein B n=1 Tax=hydrothermal vent metagenome TaxID=652676 RepID=A0A1W1D4S8_9ZZZZ